MKAKQKYLVEWDDPTQVIRQHQYCFGLTDLQNVVVSLVSDGFKITVNLIGPISNQDKIIYDL